MMIYESETTVNAVEFVKNNLNLLGKLKSISHKRSSSYETTIVGWYDKMVIKGGFSSGYVGEGSTALFDLLLSLGVPETLARKNVFENKEPKHNFEIKF